MTAGLDAAVSRTAAGLPVDVASLPARARRCAALADRLGAPRGPALRAVAAVARDEAELAGAVEVAAAEGRSVARALVVAPPVLAPLAAVLVADDPMAVWRTPLGHVVLVLAGTLWLLGWLVVRTMVRRALRAPAGAAGGPSEELLELTAIALAAGTGLPAAIRAAAAELDVAIDPGVAALWLDLGGNGLPPDGWEDVGPTLAAARRDGIPLAGLVRSLAATDRRARQQVALEQAARLSARLTLPTTLLLLPAAVLVVATPVLAGALSLLS